MLEEGLLAKASDGADPVSMAFAIHQSPSIPSGMIASKGRSIMASADEFRITVRGRGGHASLPHQAAAPIPIACEIVSSLPAMVTPRADAFHPAVVTVAQIRAGTTPNVLPNTAPLWATDHPIPHRHRRAAVAYITR